MTIEQFNQMTPKQKKIFAFGQMIKRNNQIPITLFYIDDDRFICFGFKSKYLH